MLHGVEIAEAADDLRPWFGRMPQTALKSM